MLVNFNPNVSNNRQQKHNFGAINAKYFKKAQEEVKNQFNYGDVIQEITDAYSFKDISSQDANDTLDAIKKLYPDSMKGLQECIEDAKKFVSFKK